MCNISSFKDVFPIILKIAKVVSVHKKGPQIGFLKLSPNFTVIQYYENIGETNV